MGDVIQKTEGSLARRYRTITDTITSKNFSTNHDTVFYTLSVYTYNYSLEPGHKPSHEFETKSLYYTNLDSPIFYTYQDYPCLLARDTIKSDFCWSPYINRSTYEDTAKCGVGYGEYRENSYYTGLGRGYHFSYYSYYQETWEVYLEYYNTKKQGECGTFVLNKPVSVESILNSMSIYPNPITSRLNIEIDAANLGVRNL